MNRIIDILMKRDGNTREEAIARVKETKDMMAECNYDPFESEEIFMEELGLEMDYIVDLLC